ncbi:MAG: drug/metabolite exporter YedA [Xanthomonadaceae bacterium]|nr:drug/metabolite exporter YedA [Xanthomonadaceae bacterium]
MNAAEYSLTPDAPLKSVGVIGALLIVYIVWGSTYLAIRFALESFPPFYIGTMRFTVGGLLFYGWLRMTGHPAPTPRQWRSAALLGFMLLTTGNGAVMYAQQWVGSALAATMVATVPLWAALFAGVWGRWPQRLEWVGLAIGFAGIVLLNLEGDFVAKPLMALVLVIAAASWAFGSLYSRRIDLAPGMMNAATQMLFGGLFMGLISLARGETLDAVPSLKSVAAIAYLIVFGSIIAFSAYVWLVANTRSTVATSYAYVNPLVAVLLGMTLAGERIGAVGFAAIGLVLVGVAMLLNASRSTRFG